jgi:hypothetical protein
MKLNPMLIALLGGAVVFFLWRQRQAKAIALPQGISPENVPQEWIESTPKGAPVIGTSNELYDILT